VAAAKDAVRAAGKEQKTKKPTLIARAKGLARRR
jgi:hypothetical protein